MKKMIGMSLLGLMIGSTACEDNLTQYLDDYATTMYIRNSGVQDVTCYITGENSVHSVSVVKAGNDEKAASDAKVTMMDAAQLAIYNSENGTDYQMLPSDCYIFSDADLAFSAEDPYKLVGLEFIPEKIMALDDDNYVLPLVMTSTKMVNEEKNMVLLKPTAVLPKLSIIANAGYELAKNGATISLPLKLQIDNKWAFRAQVEVDESTTTMSGFRLANDGWVDFVAGQDGELQVVFDKLNEATGKIGLKIVNIEGRTFDWDKNVVEASCILDEVYPLTKEMLFSPHSDPAEGQDMGLLLDGNVGTIWHTNWHSYTDGEHHYWEVEFPEPIKEFCFSYTNRTNTGTTMYALNLSTVDEDGTVTSVQNFGWDTHGMPYDKAGASWTSPNIELSEPTSKLRFTCTGSMSYKPYFSISEFSMRVLE